MAFFDEEMGAMLEVYLLETSQLLEQLDNVLMAAEKEGRFSREEINSIFRVMHTTKSSSAMMGLTELSELTHRLEDLFSIFREDEKRLQGVERETFALLFDASDFIKAELARMPEADYRPREGDALRARIASLLEKVNSGERITVRLRFEKDCKMENVRAFMAARQIRQLCTDIQTYPSDVEKNTATADFIRREGFYIRFVSANRDAVIRQLQGALFVESCEAVADFPEEARARAAEPGLAQPTGNFISVRVEKLDALQNLTEELMILASALTDEGDNRDGTFKTDGNTLYAERILKELERVVISIRMVAFGTLEGKLRRVVRDMCKKEKKELSFSIEGQQAEVDKKVIDGLFEPLMHLLRNAIDHGIESPLEREAAGKARAGSVSVRLKNDSGKILIEVSDDGRGMDEERILQKARKKGLLTRPEDEYTHEQILEFCFLPGFSTQENPTEYSGRGVGLDIVRRSIEALGGHLRVQSEAGRGTRFTIHMPLCLTILESFLFTVGPCVFALPAYQVDRFYAYDPEDGRLDVRGKRKLWLTDGKCLPVVEAAAFYGLPAGEKGSILIAVRGASREACLLVDRVIGKQRIVGKSLPRLFGPRFRQQQGIVSGSVLGDGTICMLMDAEDLIRAAMERGEA